MQIMVEVSEYEKMALREMLHHLPMEVQRDTCNAHLRTIQKMERSSLVTWEWFIDNDEWPPRKCRPSDRKWRAQLTGKGIQVALMLGYRTHPEERCMVPSACNYHTPFLENRKPVPALDNMEEWNDDVDQVRFRLA